MQIFKNGRGGQNEKRKTPAEALRNALLEEKKLKEMRITEANARIRSAVERLIEEKASLNGVVFDFFEERRERIEKLFGIKLLPLMRMHEPTKVRETFEKLVREGMIDLRGEETLRMIKEMMENNLLGKNTRMKLNDKILRATGGFDEKNRRIWGKGKNVEELRAEDVVANRKVLYDALIELVRKQAERFRKTGDERAEALDRIAQRLECTKKFFELMEGKVFRRVDEAPFHSEHFWGVHADAMAFVLRECAPETSGDETRCEKDGVTVEFALRNCDFIKLGDIAGDCTAKEKKRQVNTAVPNIHPTVYAWMLDAWYQILLVRYEGRMVVKAHILPLEIGGDVTLAIDAIEAIPHTRAELECCDEKLARMNDAFFEAAIKKVVELADAMGIENVVADLYSGAEWLRNKLRFYPERFVKIGWVRKLDDFEETDGGRNAFVNALASALTGEQERVFYEVQFQDDSLLYDAKDGWKNFALIRGKVGSEKKVLRQV
ncbi:MAG: hypothetical protein QXG98_00770 [Candidatus Micrarchaeia archaeon]